MRRRTGAQLTPPEHHIWSDALLLSAGVALQVAAFRVPRGQRLAPTLHIVGACCIALFALNDRDALSLVGQGILTVCLLPLLYGKSA